MTGDLALITFYLLIPNTTPGFVGQSGLMIKKRSPQRY